MRRSHVPEPARRQADGYNEDEHILSPGSLAMEEMMNRPRYAHRKAIEHPDTRGRWNLAYQAIPRGSLENEQDHARSVSGYEEYSEDG